VLIADDDRDACASLEALLHDEGHSTCCVFNGADVRARIADFGPDVVLLDIGMPGMTGYDVARDLRMRYGSAKPVLIAVTAYGKSADKLMARAAGIDHHFQKPYEPRELLGLLTKIGKSP
jgi:CheY-like chemotaxis protein